MVTEHSLEPEIIFVDDGSRDRILDHHRQLAKKDNRVRGIKFRRNFGKAAALSAGIRAARGDLIFMMDADLQDDPAEIPQFLEKLSEGFDVVNGWKVRRLDPWHKVYPSRVFNWMVARMTGLDLHDHNCGLKLFKSEVGREIPAVRRPAPVHSRLADARGFRVTEVAVNHRARQFGQSKYGFNRFLRGFLDLMTVTFLIAYRRRPQHMLGAVGIVLVRTRISGFGLSGFALADDEHHPHLEARTNRIERPLLAYSIALTLLGGCSRIGRPAGRIDRSLHQPRQRHVSQRRRMKLARCHIRITRSEAVCQHEAVLRSCREIQASFSFSAEDATVYWAEVADHGRLFFKPLRRKVGSVAVSRWLVSLQECGLEDSSFKTCF